MHRPRDFVHLAGMQYRPKGMVKSFVALCALMMVIYSAYAQDEPSAAPKTPPPWAYAVNSPGAEPEQDDGMPKHVPGSKQAFTLSDIKDLNSAPDWHPDDHPEMSTIVAQGWNPGVYACAYCHLPNGQGRPENTSLAGLPAEYIVQQMADYKAGLRRSSEPRSLPASLMLAIGATATDTGVTAAAACFSGLTP